MITTRPVDPALLYRLPPDLRGHGTHAGWAFWICRYPGFSDPLAEAWISHPYTSHSVWMPGATMALVKEWIETLRMPVAKVKAA